jgi:beta-N-acetylhexosaminidase
LEIGLGGCHARKPTRGVTVSLDAAGAWYGRPVGRRGKLSSLAAHAGAPVLTACLIMFVSSAAPAGSGATAPTLDELVGQRLVVAMSGTRASPSLLARVRAGKVGGVILFAGNVSSRSQVAALTASLQAAARAGGRPPLLIVTDQEGGPVRRLPWAPPSRSAPQLGTLNTVQVTRSGESTGAALRKVGVNADLAPVADVPTGPEAFIYRQHRAFSTSRTVVAQDATAFSAGLEAAHVLPALKHFPGLGRARVSTDGALVRIMASASALRADLEPYRVAFARGLRPLVMLSTAVYPAFDWRAAAWSPPIMTMLRHELGFGGATITDSLTAAAEVRHEKEATVALKSARAGADLLLVTGSEAASAAVYRSLLDAAESGRLPRSQLTASYTRILALKRRL